MLAHELRNPLAAISNAVDRRCPPGTKEDLEWSRGSHRPAGRATSPASSTTCSTSPGSPGEDPAPQGDHRCRARPRQRGRGRETVRRGAEARALALVQRPRTSAGCRPDAARADRRQPPDQRREVHRSGATSSSSPVSRARDVVFRVRDNGVGIPPEMLPRMFDLFAQGDRSLARSEGGLGIGLTLVKSLAEMHGGTVTATSEGPGKGSEFVVRFPPPLGAAIGPTASPGGPCDRHRNAGRGSSSSTTTRTRRRDGQAPEAPRPRRRGSPTTDPMPSTRPGPSGPRSCSWTSAFPAWTATRSRPASHGRTAARRDHHRRLRLRRRSTPRAARSEAGFDHHLVKPIIFEKLLAVMERDGLRP